MQAIYDYRGYQIVRATDASPLLLRNSSGQYLIGGFWNLADAMREIDYLTIDVREDSQPTT
jgi:hypothetical protein